MIINGETSLFIVWTDVFTGVGQFAALYEKQGIILPMQFKDSAYSNTA